MDSVRAKHFSDSLIGQSVGGWQIKESCGSGKSALVMEAVRGMEKAAVKIFDPELIERFGEQTQLGRIQRELTLRGRNHPNLVKILDGGKCPTTGHLFVAMEYLDAPNLATVLQDVPRDRIWPLICDISKAARFLEDAGLVHRDIKPDNIAITRDFSRAILLDLGVLRPVGLQELTDVDQRVFIGTLQYSSPEFLLREEEDSTEGWRSLTFYQLGAVLHDMVMKRRIFNESATPFARLVQAIREDVPVVEAKDISPDLILLARNCLVKRPDIRLKMVSWENFVPHEYRPTSTVDAKTRIRSRIALAQESTLDEEIAAEQEARSLRRKIGELQARVQALIRNECLTESIFPPIEMHEKQDGAPGEIELLVVFCSSKRLGLVYPLSVRLGLLLIDAQSNALRIDCSAGISKQRLALDQFLGYSGFLVAGNRPPGGG